MSKYECEVYDWCEGRVDLVIEALDADCAYEEARIAASERGCSNITEIIINTPEGLTT